MKSYKGILLLTISVVLTVYAWLARGMTNLVAPGLALTTLSWTFMLATRSRVLEKVFNGIERMYTVHKFLAILSVVRKPWYLYFLGYCGSGLSWQNSQI